MKIFVGSLNPVKINATAEAFGEYFDNVNVSGIETPSKVPPQPINDQTFEGAYNRAIGLKKLVQDQKLQSDFYVGIEGGITEIMNRWFAFGAMCIMDNSDKTGFGTTIHFELPPVFVNQLLNGTELGVVIDRYSGSKDTKQKGGAIEFLTGGIFDRKVIYKQGLIAALIPFRNEQFD
ncbi:inosine/xanthosine triphosphatase [candidate division KSB1 bacterium]|nr:inosine/xanthosine triphosphatase [candidate division KSB1 bacterium]